MIDWDIVTATAIVECVVLLAYMLRDNWADE